MKLLKLLLIMFIFTNVSFALFQVRVTNFGQWEIALSNYGKFGQSAGGSSGGFWPRGSGHNYMFGSGMWYGAIAPNGDTLVTIGYGPHGGEAEFGPGPAYASVYDPYWHLYFSGDEDYPYPQVSFEDSWAVSNDFDSLFHILGDTRPIGIKVTQWTRVWPRDWADDILFLRYVIKNDTNYTINSVYMGFCMDYDIGNESGMGNDQGTCDITNKLFYGWQPVPEPGWTDRGMLGLKLLSGQNLTAYKRFTLSLEPNVDWQRYMTLAGYNFNTGVYEPFDTVIPAPDDQRCLMATGVFNILPGDSMIVDWAFIASHDTVPPANDMYYKANKAQTMYNTGLHSAQVVDPNGGEVVSGLYPITYTANSITPNPLMADFFLFSENGLDTIARGVSATGSYNWQSTNVQDCVLGKIGILAFDTITFAYDRSDDYIVVDNPGNAAPSLRLLAPDSGDTLMDLASIRWFARDPEFIDSLPINIYFCSQYDSAFVPIALNENNDSLYNWYTRSFRNGRGWLALLTTDGVFTVAETAAVFINNRVSGGPVEHLAGINNTVDIEALIHYPAEITGHTYLLKFTDYHAFPYPTNQFCPEYRFDLIDSNTGSVKLSDYSISGGYTSYNPVIINEFTPIIDGFSVHSWTIADTMIWSPHFSNDSVRVLNGAYPDSLIYSMGAVGRWWAYRGSHIRLDWFTKAGGGLSIRPIDLDYGDTIPYKPYGGSVNPDSAFGWNFQYLIFGYNPSDTLRYNDIIILLCGDRIRFSRDVPAPQPGDQWLVYPKPWAPPIKGNVYRFHPVNAVAEIKKEGKRIGFQVYPVPSTRNMTIAYSLPCRQNLKIAIFDVLGRRVISLKDDVEDAGDYRLTWDGMDANYRRISAGVYFCRFETEGLQATKKIVLLK